MSSEILTSELVFNSNHSAVEPGSLGSILESSPACLVSHERPERATGKRASWPLRFAVVAFAGVTGGIFAAFLAVKPPATAAVTTTPASFVQSAPVVSPVSPAATTTVVSVPISGVGKARSGSRTLDAPEVDRLRARNRRLEALVKVMRERQSRAGPSFAH